MKTSLLDQQVWAMAQHFVYFWSMVFHAILVDWRKGSNIPAHESAERYPHVRNLCVGVAAYFFYWMVKRIFQARDHARVVDYMQDYSAQFLMLPALLTSYSICRLIAISCREKELDYAPVFGGFGFVFIWTVAYWLARAVDK